MSNQPDYITGPEFSRWTAEITRQLTANAAAVQVGLGQIERHLAEINGRTRKNTETIAVLSRDMEAIKSVDGAIEKEVEDLRTHGCAQFVAHEAMVTDLGWTRRKKATVAGGLVGMGVLAWPAVQEIAAMLHAVIDRVGLR